MSAAPLAGLWHDGTTLVAFFDTPKGRYFFAAAASLPRDQRQFGLRQVVAASADYGPGRNDGATGMVVIPLPEHLAEFPSHSLIQTAPIDGLPTQAREEFTGEDVNRIEAALAAGPR